MGTCNEMETFIHYMPWYDDSMHHGNGNSNSSSSMPYLLYHRAGELIQRFRTFRWLLVGSVVMFCCAMMYCIQSVQRIANFYDDNHAKEAIMQRQELFQESHHLAMPKSAPITLDKENLDESQAHDPTSFDNRDGQKAATHLLHQTIFKAESTTHTTLITADATQSFHPQHSDHQSQATSFKFYVLPVPEVTTDLIGRNPSTASTYYENALNEESAEVWLHRGFRNMTYQQGRTDNPAEADVVLVPGYLHLNLNLHRLSKDMLPHIYRKRIIDNLKAMNQGPMGRKKPHIILTPTWNPTVKNKIGIPDIVKLLSRSLSESQELSDRVAIWSVGFERNERWQFVSKDKIVPIPYVVNQPYNRTIQQLKADMHSNRSKDFVFYAGTDRFNAKKWVGCHRDDLLLPLIQHSKATNFTDMDIQLFGIRKSKFPRGSLSESEYNHRMRSSEYCLIMCGDTPTSRSLAASMVAGCIPLRIGSRLRGLCEEPCHKGFGFEVTGSQFPHLPYRDRVEWDEFPEISEVDFLRSPNVELQRLFSEMTSSKKAQLKSTMGGVQLDFVYGFGDPVTSDKFGNAYSAIWQSLQWELLKASALLEVK